jgi:hypothetical protein
MDADEDAADARFAELDELSVSFTPRLYLPGNAHPAIEALSLRTDEAGRYSDFLHATRPYGDRWLGHASGDYHAGVPPEPTDTLLLQLDCFGFGDEDAIYFCIAGAALKKQALGKAFAMIDE